MGHDPRRYDEGEIASRLKVLSPGGRALFACACAERLMPAYQQYCDLAGVTSFGIVRGALDAAWAPEDVVQTVSIDYVVGLAPEDEAGDLYLSAAVAQNAVASVYCALEVRQDDVLESAVWAARQLYDAADSLVQLEAPAHTYIENIDDWPSVQVLVRGIYGALDAVANGIGSAELRAAARQDGEAFLGFMNGRGKAI